MTTVYVKPIRYTHQFMNATEYFTVSFHPSKYHRAMGLLGTLSGRDCDKMAQSDLTPRSLTNAVTFKEAKETLLCRKIYRQDMDASAMPQGVINTFCATGAPHNMFIGEVIDIIR